jgi:hypothetical protein
MNFPRKHTLFTHFLLQFQISFLSLENPGNSFLRTHFGGTAIHILLDRVLSDPKSKYEIRVGEEHSGNQWKMLLKIAFDIFVVNNKTNILFD